MKQLLCILSLLAISQAYAIVNIGPKVGMGISTIIGDKTENFKSKPSYSIGAMSRLGLLFLDLQAEILYTSKGASKGATIGASGPQSEINYNLAYLEFPIIARIPVLPMLGFYGGVSFNTLLSAEKDDGNVSNIKNNTTKNETSIILGGDFTLLETISLDARYSLGLNNPNINPDASTQLNQNISLMAGYMF
jgi:hypothetical protein